MSKDKPKDQDIEAIKFFWQQICNVSDAFQGECEILLSVKNGIVAFKSVDKPDYEDIEEPDQARPIKRKLDLKAVNYFG